MFPMTESGEIEEDVAARSSALLLPCLLVVAFTSGAAGLVVELAWSRQAGLTLGQTAEAAALVLAVWFTGLASTGADDWEARQGHIPLLLHPSPRRVLFIGLETGLTALSSVHHDELQSIEIIELIPEVVLAAQSLGALTAPLFSDSRVRIVIGDGAHVLDRIESSVDVIVSDLFVPWESRTAYLYTRGFFRRARTHLEPGGLFCQWLPLYQLEATDLTMLMNTFSGVFENTTLWWGRLDANYPVLALVGTASPILVRCPGKKAPYTRFGNGWSHGSMDPSASSSGQFIFRNLAPGSKRSSEHR